MKRHIPWIPFIIGINVLYGMEKPRYDIKFTSLRSASIVVVQDDIYSRRADIIVVGINEQRRLTPQKFMDYSCAGDVERSDNDSVLVKNKVFSKYFDHSYAFDQGAPAIIVEGQRFIIKDHYEHIETRNLNSMVVNVVEPRLTFKKDVSDKKKEVGCGNNAACVYIIPRRVNKESKMCMYYGEEAFEEAQKDLALCYKNVLEKAYEFFTAEHWEKRIAFPPLSASLGIPRDKAAKIAVASVIEFIKNSPHKGQYGWIEFVVEQPEEFELYNKLFDKELLDHF